GREQAQRRADDLAAERRLLARLEVIRGDRGIHGDVQRTDREYAEAFRTFGLDLDAIDPKEAGTRLAGRPATADIAAALDEWCSLLFLRGGGKDSPRLRRLVAVARATDPDPWRNALRTMSVRSTNEADLAALKKHADDVAAQQRQPAASL